jgi:hypothetical protein
VIGVKRRAKKAAEAQEQERKNAEGSFDEEGAQRTGKRRRVNWREVRAKKNK